mmetsp:Transcript_19086/g.34425  ORF Transcript_19086/g.34425 Transcript_19086/m.34425 type:complete len:198 (-) Transcript_19086:387-980(-)
MSLPNHHPLAIYYIRILFQIASSFFPSSPKSLYCGLRIIFSLKNNNLPTTEQVLYAVCKCCYVCIYMCLMYENLVGTYRILYISYISFPHICPSSLSLFHGCFDETGVVTTAGAKFLNVTPPPPPPLLPPSSSMSPLFVPPTLPFLGIVDTNRLPNRSITYIRINPPELPSRSIASAMASDTNPTASSSERKTRFAG